MRQFCACLGGTQAESCGLPGQAVPLPGRIPPCLPPVTDALSIPPFGQGQRDLLRPPGGGGWPGHCPVHHPPHLAEPPLRPLRAVLPDPSPAPPPGKTQFQLAHCTLFDLIAVAHNHFPFRYARHFTRAGWTKAVQPKTIFRFLFFFSFGPFPVKWSRFHAHRLPQTVWRLVPLHRRRLAQPDAGGIRLSRRRLSHRPPGCRFRRAAPPDR